MSDSSELVDQAVEIAGKAKRRTVEGVGTVEQHDVDKVASAAKTLSEMEANAAAVARPGRGLRVQQFKPIY